MLDLAQTIPGRIVLYLLTKTVHIIISHITAAICCIEILQFTKTIVCSHNLYTSYIVVAQTAIQQQIELVCTTGWPTASKIMTAVTRNPKRVNHYLTT